MAASKVLSANRMPAANSASGDAVQREGFVKHSNYVGTGIEGRMYALDATTGRTVWESYFVQKEPDDVARGPQGGSPLTRASWGENSPINGGGAWTSYPPDPERGLLYIPVGNPAPDFADKLRPGRNLFTDSVVVLDAKVGAYQTHVQIVSPDWHDFDVSSAPALVTTRSGRHLTALAPKDGYR
jgi:alcohol dehydrogenase (cytochrome c)